MIAAVQRTVTADSANSHSFFRPSDSWSCLGTKGYGRQRLHAHRGLAVFTTSALRRARAFRAK